jgi:hypothetical protein
MTTVPDGESCAQCRYFIDSSSTCQRGPPSVWLATASYRQPSAGHKQRVDCAWPTVMPADWCGEFHKVSPQ